MNVRFSTGVAANPALKFFEDSGFSGRAPSARASTELTGKYSDLERNWIPGCGVSLEVGDDAREVALIERRRAEPGAHRGAERKTLRRLEPHCQLAGEAVAEIGVVLKARGDIREEFRDEITLELDVGADVVPVRIGCVGWPESREHLRAGGCDAAVLVRVEAVDIRGRLAGDDLIPLVSESRANRDCHRRCDSHRVLVTGVETEDRLGEPELAGEDVRLVRNSGVVAVTQHSVCSWCAGGDQARTEGRVECVLEVVLEPVVPDGGAKVVRPA